MELQVRGIRIKTRGNCGWCFESSDVMERLSQGSLHIPLYVCNVNDLIQHPVILANRPKGIAGNDVMEVGHKTALFLSLSLSLSPYLHCS